MKPRSRRTRRSLTVGVMRGSQRDLAYVEDISQGGMRLRGVREVQVGDALRLHAKGCVFSVEVRWVSGPVCGARFLHDSDPGEIRRFLATSLGVRQALHGVVPLREISAQGCQPRPDRWP